jgi:sugar lactone lactonase YvrE
MAAQRTRNYDIRCIWPEHADRLAGAVGASLGEGPVWIAEEGAVYWVDILGAKVFRYAPSQRRAETCPMPFAMSAIAPMDDGRLLCTGQQQIHAFDPRSGRLTCVRRLKTQGQTAIRINDGCCHPDGAFWFGTMDLEEHAPVGDFYRLAPDGACERIDVAFTITNGPAFSPAGDVGYFVDTVGRRILRAAMRDGQLAESFRLFVQIPESDGYPDGLTVDAEGGVWCSHWNGSRVTRFDADGRVSDVVRLPVSNVTKCAFGGERLDCLFITTARKGLDAAALASQPLAGGLFEVEVDYRGVPPAKYRGVPQAEPAFYTCFFETS